MLQLMRDGCSYIYPPLSITRYSFIQQSELEQRRVEKFAQGFNTKAQDLNLGSLSRKSKFLPLSHCALQGKARIPYVQMRHADAACDNECERIGVISYVQMRIRFVERIQMRQTESVQGAIQNVSAHESDKKFQGVTALQTCFPNFQK